MLSNKTLVKPHNNVLMQKKPLETLINIHNKFVLAWIDKGNGNVAFFCH